MNEAATDIDAARRHELRLLFAAGAVYAAATALIALASLEEPLSPIELAVYALLLAALVARYLPWSRLPYSYDVRLDLPYLLSGFALVVAIAVILQGQAMLYFFLTGAEGCLVFMKRSWRTIWVLCVIAASSLLFLFTPDWQNAGRTLLGSLPVYLLLVVASDLLLHQEGQRMQVERLLSDLSDAHRRL